MPTGIRIPVGVNGTGGAALVTSDDNDNKIIALALGSCDNDNAFQQDIGLGSDMIFDTNDPALRAKIMRRLASIFKDFEVQKRYRLLKNTVKWTEGDGELTLEFMYLNLESDDPKTFTKSYTSSD